MQQYHYTEKYCSRTRSYDIISWSTRTYSTSERTHEECTRTPYMVGFTSVRIRTTVSHGVRDRTALRSANRNYLYTELKCKIATATQYRFVRTQYVHNICSIIARLEVSRGQILFHEVLLYFSRVVLYFPKVPRVGRLLTQN